MRLPPPPNSRWTAPVGDQVGPATHNNVFTEYGSSTPPRAGLTGALAAFLGNTPPEDTLHSDE